MSSSLVRKALELVESEPKDLKGSFKNPKGVLKKPLKLKKKSSSDLRHRTLGDVRSEAALEVKKAKKQAVSKEDNTATNIKLLIGYSSFKGVNSSTARKIWDQTVKSKRPVDETSAESQSVFTEEDFKKFEESYFVN